MIGQKSGRGEFFAIDRRTWSLICGTGEINEAVAYLVLAQGTGASNRMTRWSVTSLKKTAGISWNRGQAALRGLMEQGFVNHAEGSCPKKPKYELMSYAEIRRSHAQANAGNADRTEPPDTADPIWLPNDIVTGTTRGEDSPIKRLRVAGDLWALRLLIDLYYEQNLRDDCGISPSVIRKIYERELVGEYAEFNLWAFHTKHLSLNKDSVFAAHTQRRQIADHPEHQGFYGIDSLCRQGLLCFVPHLWERDPVKDAAEVIHAYGLSGCGEQPEMEMGKAAHCAALKMIRKWNREYVANGLLAPIRKTIPEVQMVGIGRLRYRPKTSRTSAWWNDLCAAAPRRIAEYNELCA